MDGGKASSEVRFMTGTMTLFPIHTASQEARPACVRGSKTVMHKKGCTFLSECGFGSPPLESEQAVTAWTVNYGQSEAVPGLSELWNLPLRYHGAQSCYVRSPTTLTEGPLGGTLRLHGEGEGSCLFRLLVIPTKV